MTTTVGKYRLGAPSSILLDANGSSTVDLGSSLGGVTFNYKPSYFAAVPDQVIGRVAAWKTQEEGSIELSLPELSVQKLLAAWGYAATGVTTTASGTLGAISAPTTVVNGTAGSTSYTYKVFAFTSNGDGIPVAAPAVTTGNATLTSVNSITINWTAVTGAAGYGIERSASAGTPASVGLIGRVYGNNVLSFTDTGIVATTYAESAAQPTYPNTDTGYAGGTVSVPTHQLDLIIPKNIVGSSLNWRWTFWKVYSESQPQIDWKRDKNSEYKVTLSLMFDTTQAAGQQLFRAVEEY